VALAIGFLCAAGTTPAPARAQDDQTLKAFASWQAKGQMYETGPKQATFVGVLAGLVFVESEQGPVDAGYMVCPAYLDVNAETGAQVGKGRCTVTAKDGSRAYAEISCKGVHLIGCDGDFTFTGGTGRFEGLVGGGPVKIRSGAQDFAVGAGNTVSETSGGIMIWPKLTFKLGEKAPQ
jgi:hypothetical protein